MRTLKVYGWSGWRSECPAAPNGGRQTREIVAAHSKAEVFGIVGSRVDLCETGNAVELAVALAKPGVVFWMPLYNSFNKQAEEFREASK